MEAFLFLIRSGPRSPQARSAFEATDHLSQAGHSVSVFLLQDGVLAGLDSSAANAARALAPRAIFRVLAEDLALRGFCEGDLAHGVKVAEYSDLVEAMMESHERILGAF